MIDEESRVLTEKRALVVHPGAHPGHQIGRVARDSFGQRVDEGLPGREVLGGSDIDHDAEVAEKASCARGIR